MATPLRPESQYTHHLSVIYSEELFNCWIKPFIDLAENKWNLRLFVFERDSLAGRAIADNYADSIEKSKKVLVIVTDDLQEWEQFATRIAHTFSPSGKTARLGIVKFAHCADLDCFRCFNSIDYMTQKGKEYFWIKLYRFCTGRLEVEDIPGFSHNAHSTNSMMGDRAGSEISRISFTHRIKSGQEISLPQIPIFSNRPLKKSKHCDVDTSPKLRKSSKSRHKRDAPEEPSGCTSTKRSQYRKQPPGRCDSASPPGSLDSSMNQNIRTNEHSYHNQQPSVSSSLQGQNEQNSRNESHYSRIQEATSSEITIPDVIIVLVIAIAIFRLLFI